MSVSTSSSAASEHYWAAALFLAQPIGARWALGLKEPVAAGARSALGADVGAGPGQGALSRSVPIWGSAVGCRARSRGCRSLAGPFEQRLSQGLRQLGSDGGI